MDHHQQHHQHHEKEREEKKRQQKEHEQAEENKPFAIHPAWFLALGIVLTIGVVLVWTMF